MMPKLARGLFRAETPTLALLLSIFTQATVTLLNLCTGVVTARILGPEGRGDFAALITWPQFLSLLALAGLSTSTAYHVRRAKDDAAAWISAALIIAGLTTTVAICLSLVIAGNAADPMTSEHRSILRLALWSTYINSAILLAFQACIGLGAFRLYNGGQIATPLIYLALLSAAAAITNLSPASAVLAMIAAGFLAMIWISKAVLERVPLSWPSRMHAASLLSYAARAAPSDITSTLSTYLDKVVLIATVDRHQLGLYVVAFSASRVLLILGPAVNSVVFAHMAHRSGDEVAILHHRCLRYALHAFFIAVPALILIDKPLLAAVYGQEFEDAAVVFRLLLIEAAFASLAQVTAQAHMALGRPGLVSIIHSAALLLLVVGFLALIPGHGAIGAAAALAAAAALRLILLTISALQALGFPPPRLYLNHDDATFLWNRLRARPVAMRG